LAFLNVPVAPPAQVLTGSLLAGFIILVAGLAGLSIRRSRPPIQSRHATVRALLYALVYGLVTACFSRVIGSALLGEDRSPWLLALADVTYVTSGLFVWVMALVEDYEPRAYGFRAVPMARLVLTGLMGIGAAAIFSLDSYLSVAARPQISADTLVFALVSATLGSAIPEETLFRGYLMSSLEGRTRIWERIAIAAIAFAAVRSLRMAPALGLGSPAWMFYAFGVVLPLGLWWGLMRELAGGAIWPCLLSHFLLEFGLALSGAPPALP
jgi:membrane protease YdiL (CAAX protease family)